jgi:hypothetical protein
MRRWVGTAVALSALVVGVGLGSGAPQNAKVRLVDAAPVTLRGVDFAPSEGVKLTVVLGERKTKRNVQATRAGTFTTEFPSFRYNRCSGSLEVRAVGSKGTRVSWELISLECPDLADR